MFRNFDFKHLLPSFSEKEKRNLELYYVFTKENEREIWFKSRKDLEDHPVFGPLVKSIPKEVQEANSKESDRLLSEAVFENEWEPYVKHLMMQGVRYANMGIDFKAWHDITTLYRKYYIPILRRMYEDNQREKVTAISDGMSVLLDYVMCVIGEAFIHERNRTIEQQNKRLEIMVKELESFAYIISHDLKTPLRGIASLSDWIAQDYADKLDDTGKEYLDLLKSRTLRLEALIDGVLAYSRAGKADAEMEKLNFNDLLKEVIEMQAPSSNVTIHIDNSLPTLSNVKSTIMQVFSNLIGNAIKHNDKSAIEINIGCSEKAEEWWLYVRDNGPGIDEEFHDRIFKIFQTLKTKDEMNSTGIGLSVVKKIIDNGGGKVWIESRQGEGCTFFFTLKK